MDKLAETGNDKAFKLPRPTVDGAPLDFSFSGLKTAVINILHNAEQKGQTVNIADLPPLTARPLSIASCATSCTPQTRPAIKSSSSRAASPQTRSCAAASRKNASVPAARSICRPLSHRRQRRYGRRTGLLRISRRPYRRHGAERLRPALHRLRLSFQFHNTQKRPATEFSPFGSFSLCLFGFTPAAPQTSAGFPAAFPLRASKALSRR